MAGQTRTGIFGGTFDPVHLGHLLVACAAHEEMQLDRLIFVPVCRSPFKSDNVPADDALRLRMLRLALAGLPWCEVNDVELTRGGVSYTIDTVRWFRERHSDTRLFLLIGEDQLTGLAQWRDIGALKQIVEFVVVPRPGTRPVDALEGATFHRLNGWPFEVSSSDIRERVRAGRAIEPLVPAAVAQVIRDNRLYLG
jgi:nicotinate-nucleotide adenylyltransferase